MSIAYVWLAAFNEVVETRVLELKRQNIKAKYLYLGHDAYEKVMAETPIFEQYISNEKPHRPTFNGLQIVRVLEEDFIRVSP